MTRRKTLFCVFLLCLFTNTSLEDRENSLKNTVNAIYRFNPDRERLLLWLTKIDHLLTQQETIIENLNASSAGDEEDNTKLKSLIDVTKVQYFNFFCLTIWFTKTLLLRHLNYALLPNVSMQTE